MSDFTTIVISNGSKKNDPSKTPLFVSQGASVEYKNVISDDPEPIRKPSHTFKMSLQQARMGKKLTQKQLASMLNINEHDIKKFENGLVFPPPQLLSRINSILGTKLKKDA